MPTATFIALMPPGVSRTVTGGRVAERNAAGRRTWCVPATVQSAEPESNRSPCGARALGGLDKVYRVSSYYQYNNPAEPTRPGGRDARPRGPDTGSRRLVPGVLPAPRYLASEEATAIGAAGGQGVVAILSDAELADLPLGAVARLRHLPGQNGLGRAQAQGSHLVQDAVHAAIPPGPQRLAPDLVELAKRRGLTAEGRPGRSSPGRTSTTTCRRS